MLKLRFRPEALRDLDAISDYSEKQWGREQAKRYALQLQQGFETILAHPSRGQDMGDHHPGYRRLKVGSHIVFYRADERWLEIVRILHARMDFLRHL